MENATKALLIAGSVLIAIVLIAVGIKILGSTSGVTEQVGQISNSLETSIFNSQYTQYEGTQKRSAIRALYRLVQQNNSKNSNRQIEIWIGQQGAQETKLTEDILESITGDAKFSVKLDDKNNDGYVDYIFLDS